MKTVEGRRWASREDLIERSGYSRETLSKLWRDRVANGHPEARDVDGIMHWDIEVWEGWFGEHRERPRDLSGVDRSGDPDELLPPAGQARLLGVDPARITQYTKKPPPGWPDAAHTEQLTTRTREYRTRAQLWEWVDDPVSGFGTAGGRPPGPGVKSGEERTAARLRLAVEALVALPGRKAGEVAAALAERHGGSVDTWKRVVTKARKVEPDSRVQLAKDALASMEGRAVAEVAAALAERHGWAVKTWERIIADARRTPQR